MRILRVRFLEFMSEWARGPGSRRVEAVLEVVGLSQSCAASVWWEWFGDAKDEEPTEAPHEGAGLSEGAPWVVTWRCFSP